MAVASSLETGCFCLWWDYSECGECVEKPSCKWQFIRLLFHNMKMHKDRLTERQRLFCEHYVGAGRHCAALAARLAGYAPGCSHVTGCQLLKKPKIAATVRGLEDAVSREIRFSRQGLIAEMMGIAELALSVKEPGSAATAISALRQVGLMAGYYRQDEAKKENLTDRQGAVQASFASLSDSQLLALIAQGAVAA
jgi:hypothetical protein